jgi:hypothetical protein
MLRHFLSRLNGIRRSPKPALVAVSLALLIAAAVVFRHSWSWGDFPTWVLAVGAIITVYYARQAFREQGRELTALQQQVEQQAELLKVQSNQFDDQRKVNQEQTKVLGLQAEELEASLTQRKDEAERLRREQANKVAAWFGPKPDGIETAEQGPLEWGAFIQNDSDLPIYNIRASFHFIATDSPASPEWQPIFRGSPPNRIRVIPPKYVSFVQIPDQTRNMIDRCDDDTYVVSIEFTDAAGNLWKRDPRGTLLDG